MKTASQLHDKTETVYLCSKLESLASIQATYIKANLSTLTVILNCCIMLEKWFTRTGIRLLLHEGLVVLSILAWSERTTVGPASGEIAITYTLQRAAAVIDDGMMQGIKYTFMHAPPLANRPLQNISIIARTVPASISSGVVSSLVGLRFQPSRAFSKTPYSGLLRRHTYRVTPELNPHASVIAEISFIPFITLAT